MQNLFDPNVEAQLQTLLQRLKANEDAKNGSGSFDRLTARGKLMMSKRASDLTETERAFLNGDTEKLN
jgi:hypothetical protein